MMTHGAGHELRARYLKDRWSLRGPHLVFLVGIHHRFIVIVHTQYVLDDQFCLRYFLLSSDYLVACIPAV